MDINPRFRDLIQPLTTEEYAQLEANIIADGCRDPLVVWFDDREYRRGYCKGCRKVTDWRTGDGNTECDKCGYGVADENRGTLIDGHNRYEICQKHNLPFETDDIDFADEDEACVWIIRNQFGRRNLSPYTRGELALKLEPLIAKKAKANLKTSTGGNNPRPSQNSVKAGPVDTQKELAKVAHVSHDTISKVKLIAAHADEATKQKLRANELSIHQVATGINRELKEAKREDRRETNREKVTATNSIDIATGAVKFATIVLDPPWDWGDEGDCDQLGRARPTYATMSLEELKNLPVGKCADDDCHLYLWITNRSLPKGFALLEEWGFRYVTCLTWCKPSFGMGNYFRGQTEQILFGVKGSQPLKRKDVGTFFNAERGPGGHSSKPDAFYDLVESCSPGPYLEMFSRRSRKDWQSWGADANG